MSFEFITIDQQFTREAVAYLDRADDERIAGNVWKAKGLERKCLRKLEKSFSYRYAFDASLRRQCDFSGVSASAPLGL